MLVTTVIKLLQFLQGCQTRVMQYAESMVKLVQNAVDFEQIGP
jgi:hypothetical protein